MIRNLVFDMGQVLIRFCPEKYVAACTENKADQKLLLREVLRSQEWAQTDRGNLSDQAAADAMRARLPERLRPAVDRLVFHWNEPLVPVPGMQELVYELKQKGYRLYLLSNATQRQHEYWQRVPGHDAFDGTLISADWRMIKPEPGIFHALFSTFSLQPQECLFVDDSAINVAAADAVGMRGIVFDGSAETLRTALNHRGI